MWTSSQLQRIYFEVKITKQRFPQFRWTIEPTCATVRGEIRTSDASEFLLHLALGQWFPYEPYRLILEDPSELWSCDGRKLTSMGPSHEFHLAEPSPEKLIHICTYMKSDWLPSNSCLAALYKGLVWCHAFTLHRATGRPLCDFVNAETMEKYLRGYYLGFTKRPD